MILDLGSTPLPSPSFFQPTLPHLSVAGGDGIGHGGDWWRRGFSDELQEVVEEKIRVRWAAASLAKNPMVSSNMARKITKLNGQLSAQVGNSSITGKCIFFSYHGWR